LVIIKKIILTMHGHINIRFTIKAKLYRLIYEELVNKEISYQASENRTFYKLATVSLIT